MRTKGFNDETDTATAQLFKLPPLPYATDALAPHLSQEAMELHHGKHHAAYVKKLNELVHGTPFFDRSLEKVILSAEGPIFDNAAQHWNHSFFWRCMSPQGGGEPGSTLGEAIASRWGSTARFKEAFTDVAMKIFGSGWAWLVVREGTLALVTTHDAGTPMTDGDRPLLAVDAWEHAYYVDYRNERAKYLEHFWNVVNWEFASDNLAASWSIEP